MSKSGALAGIAVSLLLPVLPCRAAESVSITGEVVERNGISMIQKVEIEKE